MQMDTEPVVCTQTREAVGQHAVDLCSCCGTLASSSSAFFFCKSSHARFSVK